MPELPEVETITNRLRAKILNSVIIDCDVHWWKSISLPNSIQFKEQIKGQRVVSLSRRGKYILIQLSRDVLIIHLRMSGDLTVEPNVHPISKHDQVVFQLDDGQILKFNDTRKFGRVWLTDDPAIVVGKLGPEPLSKEFTPEILFALLQSKHRQIKPLLLDQTFIAGLGNIYTDEALFEAGISPRTNSAEVVRSSSERLHAAIQKSLFTGIENNGASIDWVYKGGGFQNHFRVYQRNGQPCFKCGNPIQKTVIGQRGTHFCPNCQPFPGG